MTLAGAAVIVLLLAVIAWFAWPRGRSPPSLCDGVQCAGGSTCSPATGRCACGSGRCPPGWQCDGKACYAQATCPAGSEFDPSLNACTVQADPIWGCPPGFVFDPSTGGCAIGLVSCPSGGALDPATGNCVMQPLQCPDFPCPPGQTCNAAGQCASTPPPSATCQGGVDMMTAQPPSTVQIINNTTEAPFHVFFEYANYAGMTLDPPDRPWAIQSASPGVVLRAPVSYYPQDAPPPGATPPFVSPNAIGAGTWQELIMPARGDAAILQIPNYPKHQAWSIRPLKFHDATHPCQSDEGDCGMPILIESGKDMVGDMSAVDGVNFLLCYEFTTRDGSSPVGVSSIIDFKKNPCRAAGLNVKGCRNPSVDGIFIPSLVGTSECFPAGDIHCWLSAPCPAGTCNLTAQSQQWCDAIHEGQCANSSSTWTDKQRGEGGPPSCSDHNLFTTYCYSHDDATSSPYFSSLYKMKLVYSDLQ